APMAELPPIAEPLAQAAPVNPPIASTSPRAVPPGAQPARSAPSVPASRPLAPAAPSRAEELYRAGVEQYQKGDLDAAVVTFYEVVANFGNDPARERAQFQV